jgi:hypothetical protein
VQLLAEVSLLQAQGRVWGWVRTAWLLHAEVVGALRLQAPLLLGRQLHQRLCSWQKQPPRPASEHNKAS